MADATLSITVCVYTVQYISEWGGGGSPQTAVTPRRYGFLARDIVPNTTDNIYVHTTYIYTY